MQHKTEEYPLGEAAAELSLFPGLGKLAPSPAGEARCLLPPRDGALRYRVPGEGEGGVIDYAMTVFDGEDAAVIHPLREILLASLKAASARLRGTFVYTLIACRPSAGLSRFESPGFSSLIENHARRLENGEARLIRYTTLWGVLRKLVDADWGTIQPRLPLTEPACLDALERKIGIWCRGGMPGEGERTLVIADIGPGGGLTRAAARDEAASWRKRIAGLAGKKSGFPSRILIAGEKEEILLGGKRRDQAPA